MGERRLPKYEMIRRELQSEIANGDRLPGQRFITERELCERFGVSSTTAVRVLNDLVREGLLVRRQGSGTFVAENHEEVTEPEYLGGDGRTVACIFADLSGRHVLEIIRGAESACRRAGYHMLLFDSSSSAEMEAANISRARAAGARGVIVFPIATYSNESRFMDLIDRGFPLVMVDRYYPTVPSDVVVPDNFAIGYEITKYLVEKGHSNIAVLASEIYCTSVQDRLAGYRVALQRYNLPIVPGLVSMPAYTSFPTSERLRLLDGWLHGRHKPTAFLGVNGETAYQLARDLLSLGIEVPGELTLARMDNTGPNEVAPFLSVSASLPSYELGITAMERLLDIVSETDSEREPEHAVIPTELVVSGSVPVRISANPNKDDIREALSAHERETIRSRR